MQNGVIIISKVSVPDITIFKPEHPDEKSSLLLLFVPEVVTQFWRIIWREPLSQKL